MPAQAISYASETRAAEQVSDAGDPLAFARNVRLRALGGSLPAVVSMGHLHLAGHGLPRDPAAAYRWFAMAADGGSPEGANMVGRCHELGIGVSPDHGQAAHWYRIAADRGDAWGMFNLGGLLMAGRGVAMDRSAALSLFVASARKGNIKAVNMLGRFREEGWGVRAKHDAARRWYQRAARGGCFRGQFHSGRFALLNGDVGEAADWFANSVATAPEDFCRDAAGVLLACRDEVVRRVGIEALRRAAAAGEARDLHALGSALATMPQPADRRAALHWLCRSRAVGHRDADILLARLLADPAFLRGTGIRWRLAAWLAGMGGWFKPKGHIRPI